jgi:hypothetical protein
MAPPRQESAADIDVKRGAIDEKSRLLRRAELGET